MKKLVIILAALAASVAVHAATVNWSGMGVAKQDASDVVTSYSIYLLDTAKATTAAMTEALAKGDTSLVASAMVNTTLGVAVGDLARWGVQGWGDYAEGSSHTWYTVIFNNSIDNATHFMVTKEVTATAPATGAMPMGFGSQAANTWHAITPVPEPTSGLLVLVGIGALALRRRRA